MTIIFLRVSNCLKTTILNSIIYIISDPLTSEKNIAVSTIKSKNKLGTKNLLFCSILNSQYGVRKANILDNELIVIVCLTEPLMATNFKYKLNTIINTLYKRAFLGKFFIKLLIPLILIVFSKIITMINKGKNSCKLDK